MKPVSPDPTAPSANRRRLLLAGAGAGGVLVGLVALVALAGSEGAAPSPPPAATVVAEPEATADPHPELAFSVTRDPFEQLVTPADPEAATGPLAPEVPVPAEVPVAPAPPIPAPPAASGTPPPAGAGAAEAGAPHPPAPVPTAAPEYDPPTPGIWYFPASTPPPSQHPPPQEPRQEPSPEVLSDPEQLMRWMFEHMRLWSVLTDDAGTPRAFITIDDHAYHPAEGQVFREHFRVERIDAHCVEVSAPGLHPGICVPTPEEAGDATAEQPTAAQACVVARQAPPHHRSTGRPRLGLTPCDRVAPATRYPV